MLQRFGITTRVGKRTVGKSKTVLALFWIKSSNLIVLYVYFINIREIVIICLFYLSSIFTVRVCGGLVDKPSIAEKCFDIWGLSKMAPVKSVEPRNNSFSINLIIRCRSKPLPLGF